MQTLYIRVELDDEHDAELLDYVKKEIEKITGVLEVFPVVEAAQQSVQADAAYCTCPTPYEYSSGNKPCGFCGKSLRR
jgi:hypothetical protein